jgi:hypothetical protein
VPRFPVLLLSLTALLALAPASAPGSLRVLSPGHQVETFHFTIEVQIPSGSDFDPGEDVTLNGVAIPVSGGPTLFTASVSPGFPLQDHNQLEVSARSGERQLGKVHRFHYRPDKALVRRIEHPKDLIEGPLAHGRVGDWLIENAAARFVVQDVGKRDLYSVGGFGGNVIDLELKSNPGNDNFIEIQPMLNLETVVNAQTIEVVNDGQDGTAAILRTCGPDDLLDFVNPSSTIADAGITPPPGLDDNDQPVDACTEYRLEPQLDPACESCGAPSWLRLETTVMNLGTERLRMLVGDWYNPGGQLETWARPERMGEALSNQFSTFSHFGYGEFEGVDYAYSTLPLTPPVPPGTTPSNQFTTSGVSVILHDASVLFSLLGAPPPFFVNVGSERSFARVLGVGDGSGANAVAMRAATQSLPSAQVEGCVTVAGTPLPGSRVSVVLRDEDQIVAVQESSIVTGPGPCPNYAGTIQPGSWEVAAWRRGTPYEGGLGEPTFHAIDVAGDGTATLNIDLPATGRLEARVVDEVGRPLPARVSVIGIDPSPPITEFGAFVPGFGGSRLGLFEDPKEALPHGIVAFGYSNARGDVAFDVEPGSYQLVVSRGTEYSIHQAPLTISAGSTASQRVQLARVLDTAGFVSSDFHVHGIRSADSRVADGPRVSQFAGEGVENIIMTDHHVHTDLLPVIARLGLTPWVTSTIGEEITTFDYGHFNG